MLVKLQAQYQIDSTVRVRVLERMPYTVCMYCTVHETGRTGPVRPGPVWWRACARGAPQLEPRAARVRAARPPTRAHLQDESRQGEYCSVRAQYRCTVQMHSTAGDSSDCDCWERDWLLPLFGANRRRMGIGTLVKCRVEVQNFGPLFTVEFVLYETRTLTSWPSCVWALTCFRIRDCCSVSFA